MSDNNKLYVGNLSFTITTDQLGQMFSEYGEITDAVVIMDRIRNRSKGFGFVTFANAEDADKAEQAMNGKEVDGRALVVNKARPMKPRQDRGGFRN